MPIPSQRTIIWSAVIAGFGIIQAFFLSLSLFSFSRGTQADRQGIYLEHAFYERIFPSLFWLKVAVALLFLFGPLAYLYNRYRLRYAIMLAIAEIITAGVVYWLYWLIRTGAI